MSTKPGQGHFAVRAIGPRFVTPGGELRVWVRVLRPYGGAAVAGARVRAALELDDSDDDSDLDQTAVTDAAGRAQLVWTLPRGAAAPDPEMGFDDSLQDFTITLGVSAGEQTQKLSLEGTVLGEPGRWWLASDRRLYRPGEDVLLRAQGLLVEPLPANVAIEARDPAERRLWRGEAAVSRHGIAAARWPVPTSAPAGSYQLHALVGERIVATTQVEIRPYELPTMRITARFEPEVVLPGTTAELRVEARRSDGSPVAGAEVTVDASERSRWGPAWPSGSGTTDADGVARVALELTDAFAWLGDERRSAPLFLDAFYEAEVRDPLSARRQIATAALRVSREPIHLYLLGSVASLPVPKTLWVSASHADGRPARCRIRIGNTQTTAAKDDGIETGGIETDVHGLARLELDAATRAALENAGGWLDASELIVEAETAAGERGRWRQGGLGLAATPAIFIVPERSLLRAGEPLVFELVPSEPTAEVVVEVSAGGRRLASRHVTGPRRGLLAEPTRVVFPYQEGFAGIVTVRAFSLAMDPTAPDAELVAGSRRFLYPRGGRLELRLEPERVQARPGERVGLGIERSREARAGRGVRATAALSRRASTNLCKRIPRGHPPSRPAALCSNGPVGVS